ncbi:MAG: AAA family ATPase [Butyrivibrio sp.]|nr:AAA family ATPase [Butyrivibrio sp.]
MIYLSQFSFPGKEAEYDVYFDEKRTCYDSFYPFGILSRNALSVLDFEPITILYGDNGSGKSTALNVIAEKLRIERDTLFNRSSFMEKYTDMCDFELRSPIPPESRIITSDDVFDFMLNLRAVNEGIDRKRGELFEEYMDAKYSKFQMKSLDDYERLKKVTAARSKTQSRYIRENLMDNVREHSNGESALIYFSDKIKENALYLLDEPENSLSPAKQQELLEFLENSARFFGCQLIIATHSPFILSLRGAKIYDLDENPADIKKWTELPNVAAYYEFFKKHSRDFEK